MRLRSARWERPVRTPKTSYLRRSTRQEQRLNGRQGYLRDFGVDGRDSEVQSSPPKESDIDFNQLEFATRYLIPRQAVAKPSIGRLGLLSDSIDGVRVPVLSNASYPLKGVPHCSGGRWVQTEQVLCNYGKIGKYRER
jgi:hypothetical protein